MCSKNTLQTVLHDLYTKLNEIYGSDLENVILYGSYARGDYDDESDIDVIALVKCDDNLINKLRDDVISLISELGVNYDVVLSVHVKNKVHFKRWKEHLPYYRNIVNEGVEISA